MPWLVMCLVVRTLYSCDREEPKSFRDSEETVLRISYYAIRRYRFNKIFAIRSVSCVSYLDNCRLDNITLS